VSVRVGLGYDRHRLVEGRPCVLGGVELAFDRGLEGHSDADCLSHAICDALLGAAALGDLGGHFADTDPVHRGRRSLEFLTEVASMLADRGLRIANVDSTVIAELPRLAPHVDRMRAEIAGALGIGIDRVSVKATRGEGVGPEGRGEAISAQAVALVEDARGETSR
jgi:2-C-methyl-D-erythritol 2,4-cyclodiphosphate synthase